jgi:hypothetical protein
MDAASRVRWRALLWRARSCSAALALSALDEIDRLERLAAGTERIVQ